MHRSWTLVFLLLAVTPGLLAQSSAVDEALAMPVSPGALALLAEYPDDPRAAERIVGAMSDPRAEVRAAAARVAFVGGVATAPVEAARVLAEETDRSAAIELMRVVAVSGPSSAEPVLAAARRLQAGSAAGLVLASFLGTGALDSMPELRDMSSGLDLSRFLSLASRGNLAALGPPVAAALREGDSELWEAYLETARDAEASVADGTLLFGLSTSNEAMRFATVWHLLLDATAGGRLSQAVRTALLGRRHQSPSALGLEEAFAYELLLRHLGEDVTERREWVSMLRTGDGDRMPMTSLGRPERLRLLTRDEVRALSELSRGDPKAMDGSWERARDRGPAERTEGPTVPQPRFRTLGGYPPGFLEDLIRASGCELRERAESGTIADVQFSLTGRPLAVTFRMANASALQPCDRLGRALVLTSIDVPSGSAKRGSSARLLVLHSEPYFACLREMAAWQAPPVGRATSYGEVAPPRKTKDKAPEYPESARQERVQGIVILEAIITETGCVHTLRVLRSPDERLDVAAIIAVMQWRYEPSRIDGTPVPIVMTVTVNFTLS